MCIRLFVRVLTIACLSSGVATSAASASLPEISYTGVGYVTFTGKEGSLETITGITVTCKEVLLTGFLGASPTKNATSVKATFKGCKSAGKTCTTTKSSAGEIVTQSTYATFGYVKKATPKEVGISVGEWTLPLAYFKCGESNESTVWGDAIALVGSESEYNVAKSSFPMTFAKGLFKGMQAITKFEGGIEDRLEAAINGNGIQPGNIQQTGIMKLSSIEATIKA